MKLWIKVLFIIFIIFAVALSSLHIFINLKGKLLLVNKLKNTFNKEVKIGSVKTSFPLNLIIRDIEVKDLFKINEVFAGGGAIDILRRNFILSELRLNRVVANIERPLEKAALEILSVESQKTAPSSVPDISPTTILSGKFLFPKFTLKHLIISDGVFNFIDKGVGDKGIVITVKDVNIQVENLNFLARSPIITSFQLKGRIPWQQGQEEGKIEAEGWLNLFKKDMQATLKIEGIDGIYLYPYYSNWVNLEKARIEKAKLNFTSNINGLNNNVTVQCHLELTDIVRRPRPEGEPGEKAGKITDVVLDIFRALNQGKIVLDFTIRTKMDKPRFGFGDIKMAFEDKLAEGKKTNGFKPEDALLMPAKLIEGLFKGTTDLTTAVITGTINAGKEIGKTVEGALKKEGKKEEKKE